MPKVEVRGVELAYEESGTGPETIVFSHGFLMNREMFRHQIDALSKRYRVIAYDHRSHGQSSLVQTPYDIYALVDDAVGLIEALCEGPVHFVGMSTGGYVGLRLLTRHPQLLRSLVLVDTAANAENEAAISQYDQLLFAVRWFSTHLVIGKAIELLFGPVLRVDPTRKSTVRHWRDHVLALDRKGLVAFGRAIFHRDDVLPELKRSIPSLVLVGEHDIPTPLACARAMAGALGAELRVIPHSGHTSPVEEPQIVTAAIESFLSGLQENTAMTRSAGADLNSEA